jgi:AcrR family transcriptional regulator
MRSTAPKRLPAVARREQLEAIALAVVAEHGSAGISLEDVAERAGVTRSLLYHYFPRGQLDVYVAAVERAGRELTDGWIVDERLAPAERAAANLRRVLDHALEPSQAWLVYREAQASRESDVVELGARYREVVLSSIAVNQFGTPDPGELRRLALDSFIAFVERALDQSRERGVDPDEVAALIQRVLAGVVDATRELDG